MTASSPPPSSQRSRSSQPSAAPRPRAWARPGAAARTALTAVPAPGLVLLGIVSVQVGAGLAKQLFAQFTPSAVVFLRIATGALILAVLARPRLRGLSRRDLGVVLTFGVTLGLMNLTFYEALARLPIGIAVTVEFLGPLGVAVATSRRRLDLLWVTLAGAGIALLAPWSGGSVDLLGLLFAALAGVCWAGYIILSATAGSRIPGTGGLTAAMLVATVVIAPFGVASGAEGLLSPHVLLIGVGVGLLSSVIPYTLELEALRRMPKRVFGILMSLEPAAAALVGLIVLHEFLTVWQWSAIACVVVASVGATRTQDPPPQDVVRPDGT
ncbi:DMT family transporter [Sphaerisporangium rubeum]|uniref:Inner membrane transporter RhtA n=1 Tax=Sphaerisporangium rubeum TaxID=321317 RepID=A0A7X0IEJ3_9ACTN|nr:DMT family transporter [Sphaerisporangium rubeum]MBB6473513.1 inner membrane transporter RhtA [Sphaerisporangium rubeum]